MAARLRQKPLNTRREYTGASAPVSVSAPAIPDSLETSYEPFVIDTQGTWGVLTDCHFPYHSVHTLNRAIEEGKRRNVVGWILNGDQLDFYGLSDFYRDPNKARVKTEIEIAFEFLKYLRGQFPKARIIFKEGNHDERLKHFLARRAPEIFDLPCLQLDKLLEADKLGLEWVRDRRVIMLGELPLLHGHEYRGSGGVMPARWLYLRTRASAACGHFHQPSEYTCATVTGRAIGTWSIGCACALHPYWLPLNDWRNGYAMVEVNGRHFAFDNRKLLPDGSVV
jgi:predicted phosphodiesterase